MQLKTLQLCSINTLTAPLAWFSNFSICGYPSELRLFQAIRYWYKSTSVPSSETQGQLVGTTGFSWAKVYNKSGRAPGHLLLPNEFQKRLKSRLLIGLKNIFRSTGTFLRRASEKKKLINKRSRGNRKL